MRLPRSMVAVTCLALLAAAKPPHPPFDLGGSDQEKFLDVVEWLGSLDDLSKESVVTKGLNLRVHHPKKRFIELNGVRIPVIPGGEYATTPGSKAIFTYTPREARPSASAGTRQSSDSWRAHFTMATGKTGACFTPGAITKQLMEDYTAEVKPKAVAA